VSPEDEVRIADLERAIDHERELGRRAGREIQRLETELAETWARLASTQRQLDGLLSRRSVRIARSALTRSRAVLANVRSRPPKTPPTSSTSDDDERRLLDRLRPQIGGPAPTSGPLVSIVMLNLDGEAELRACLPAIARTAYQDIELIFVDNGSTDASLAFVEAWRPRFPVRILRNDHNASYSDGNNQGVLASSGELVLFLNNDTEPIAPEWLGHLVETIAREDVGAVGARLIHPRRPGSARGGTAHADLTLQHGGVAFTMRDGVPSAMTLGAGEDAASDWAAAIREEPALTAACLLVRRADLDAVGGFTSGYVYGQEDVDLCLKLRCRGRRLLYDGRAALWHHVSATRVGGRDDGGRRARNLANQDLFVSHWAPRLYRTVLLDLVGGGGFWRRTPLHVGIVGPPPGTASATGTASFVEGCRRHGYRVSPVAADIAARDVDPTIDVLVLRGPTPAANDLPAGIVRVAWVEATDPSTATPAVESDADIVMVAAADEDAAAAFTAALSDWLDRPRVGIRIPVGAWDRASAWGDTYVAHDLKGALDLAGWPTRLHLRHAWDRPTAARDDVTIDMLGRVAARPRPGRCNVLWHLSHPDVGSAELYGRYDLAFVASDGYAAWMAGQVATPVRPLHQATDPRRFRPVPNGHHHELLFVAGWRPSGRHILDDLLPTDHELAVYGSGWTPDVLDPALLAGDRIPNDEVGGYYAAADIVLNDHWLDMQREGFLSNRLYDASAAGAFVITDAIDGLDAEFDGGIVAYRDRDDLRVLVDRYLGDPAARRAAAERARQAVIERHTFDARARTLIDAIGPLLAGRLEVIPGRSPSTDTTPAGA
jgi:GT2 family glycosyltransferase